MGSLSAGAPKHSYVIHCALYDNDQDHMRDEQGLINYILKKSKSLSKFRTKNKNFAIWAFGLQHSKKAFNK